MAVMDMNSYSDAPSVDQLAIAKMNTAPVPGQRHPQVPFRVSLHRKAMAAC